RRRDGAAPLHVLDRRRPAPVEPARRARLGAAQDLRVLRVAGPRGPRARVGGGPRPDQLRPRREPYRPRARGTQPAAHGPPSLRMATTVATQPERRVDLTPQATLPPPERRETVFDIRGLTASYAGVPAISNVSMEIYENLVTAVIGP